jgi:hypothetical protein
MACTPRCVESEGVIVTLRRIYVSHTAPRFTARPTMQKRRAIKDGAPVFLDT